ncbi:hypothetical protein [Vibrio parahaemolyticus]|uniref:hypothetical protein n=1 Tax=Vibrio parahaemolyticus TaxID=670 RepID=UPI00344ECAC0|nr:hypothetical protein [Vibrio parahaemolyticus]
MKTINVVISDDNKHAVSDWNVYDWCKSLKDGDTAHVATSLMFNELRISVAQNEIKPFSFEFNGNKLSVCEKGELVGETRCWPKGFFDQQSIQVRMLMSGKDRDEVTKSVNEQKDRYNQAKSN